MTTTEPSTELSAQQQLDRLEQAAVDGVQVTPSELAEARARVTLSGLFAKGAAARAEKKRLEAAARLRETAKAEAVAMLETYNHDQLEAYDAAVAALERLVNTLDENNDRLSAAASLLSRAQVPGKSSNGAAADGIDLKNYVAMRDGGRVDSLVAGGIERRPESPSQWVSAAVLEIARAHAGLPLPGGSKLERLIPRNIPITLKSRED